MLDRHLFPQHGWLFRQIQTGWVNPMPLAYTFDRSVEEIIRHRKKNPAITAKHKLSTDFDTVADELEKYTMKRLGITESPKTLASPLGFLARVGVAAVAARNIAIGAQNLLAWSDSGKVVPKEVADARALICTAGGPGNTRCPMNGTGDWKQLFTTPAAELIKNQLSAKASMKLDTKYDATLGVCEVCACPLPLKVWAPLENALRKMSKETKEKLPEWCWMKMGTKP